MPTKSVLGKPDNNKSDSDQARSMRNVYDTCDIERIVHVLGTPHSQIFVDSSLLFEMQLSPRRQHVKFMYFI